MEKKQLFLTVKAREQTLYSGEVASVTSYNEKGKFDVLGEHANFISIIEKYLIVKQVDGRSVELKLDSGIIRVLENKIDVFLGVKQTPEKERPLRQ